LSERKTIMMKRHSLSVDGQSESDGEDGFPVEYIRAKIEKMN
jgi:hypothetical protein